MEIRKFTLTDLERSVRSNDLWYTGVIPITKQRAIAQVKNPRADKDDVLLIVGYDGGQVVGHIGIIPDRICLGDVSHKIGWLTAWWADCKQNKALGAILLFEAMSCYNREVAVSGFTDQAASVYEATNSFVTMKRLKGSLTVFRCDLRKYLSRISPIFNKFTPVLKAIDCVLNCIQNLRISVWKIKSKQNLNALSFEYIREIDKEANEFIEKHQESDLSRRGVAELNWIVRYPWVLASPPRDRLRKRYVFSYYPEHYFYLNVKVFSCDDKMIGFMMFKIVDNVLEVPYYYFDKRQIPLIVYALGYHIIELKTDVLKIHNEDLQQYFSLLKFPHLIKKSSVRHYIVSEKFKNVKFGGYNIQDGDGEAVFV